MKKFLILSLAVAFVSTALFSCGGGDDDEPQNPNNPSVTPGDPDNPDQPNNPGSGGNDHNPELPELAAQFENIYSPLISDEGFMADSDVTEKLIGDWSTDGKYDQNLVLLPNGRFRLSEGGSWQNKWEGWGDWAYNSVKSTLSLIDANVSIEITSFNSAGDKFAGSMRYQSSTEIPFSATKKNEEYNNPDSFLKIYSESLYWDNVDAEGKHVSNDQPLMPWSMTGIYNNHRYALTEHCSYLINDDLVMIVYWNDRNKGVVNAIWWIEKPWSASPRMVAYIKPGKFKYYIGTFRNN